MKRAILLGTALLLGIGLAALTVAGEPVPRRRAGGPSRPAPAEASAEAPADAPADMALLDAGRAVYDGTCAMCHQPTGSGLPGMFPPLAGSDFLARDPQRIVAIVLRGIAGPIVVNGEEYNGAMPPLDRLSDAEIASVTTFVLNSWSNPGGTVTPERVGAERNTSP